MDPFFLQKKTKTKQRSADSADAPAPKRARKQRDAEPAPEADAPDDDLDLTARVDGSVAEAYEETADEKRVRLAKQYLERVRDDAGSDADDQDISDKLLAEAAELAGKSKSVIAGKLRPVDASAIVTGTRSHKLSVTCVAVSDDGRIAFSGSKDGTVCKWDAETGKCLAVYPATDRCNAKGQKHKAQVMTVALSTDGKFLAAGGEDRAVHVYDVSSDKKLESMVGHRDTVSALAWRQDSHQLYSGSLDRTVKLWNADTLSYIESLFGHQAGVMGLDALLKERAVSCGQDNTLRVWKIVEETQLLFRGHTASIDCVSLLNESLFVAGSQDGAISVWSPSKKKAACTREAAHGAGQWISSVSACRRSDLIATGSGDGFVRLWNVRYGHELRPGDGIAGLGQVSTIPVDGFVNGLAFAKKGKLLVAGVGQEHRLGRWQRNSNARNGLLFIPLQYDA